MFGFLQKNVGVRFVIPFIAGILLSSWILLPNVIWVLLFLLLVGLVLLHKYSNSFTSVNFGVIATLVFLLLGWTRGQINNAFVKPVENKAIIWHVHTLNIPKEVQNGYSCPLHISRYKADSVWYTTNINVNAFFMNDSLVKSLRAGQELLINTSFSANKRPQNPFGFDAQKYLKTKNLKGVLFIRSNQWQCLKTERKGLALLALNLRGRLVDIFTKAGISGQNHAVVSALALGYKDSLEIELTKAYSKSGTVHLLAVSGMHVAIVVMVLAAMLSFMDHNKRLFFLKQLILLAGIWFYAFLTGLSPSVVRAAVMFSFIVVAALVQKKASVYNSIGWSALFILFFKPWYLFDIGFQLSYIAVIGILFFYPYIEKWITLPGYLGQKIWQLAAVSLAAQLATTPLILLYFKQFPVYFLLSNIVVVVIATLVLYGGLLLLVVSMIPWVMAVLGKILNVLVNILNYLVVTISYWPGSVIEHISITPFQCFLLFVILGMLTALFLLKQYRYAVISFAVILLFQSTLIIQNIAQWRQKAFCVYYLKDAYILHFIHGPQSYTVIPVSDNYQKHLDISNLSLDFWRIKPTNNLQLTDTSQFTDANLYFHQSKWVFNGHKGILDNGRMSYQFNDTLAVDVMVVNVNSTFLKRGTSPKVKSNKLVFDGTVSEYLYKKREKISTNTPYFVRTDGAFIHKFP